MASKLTVLSRAFVKLILCLHFMSPVSCSVGDPYIGCVVLQYRISPLLLSITELEELFRARSIILSLMYSKWWHIVFKHPVSDGH